MRVLLPFLGLVVCVCGIRAWKRTRTRAAFWYALCWSAVFVALAFWPMQNGKQLDALIGIPGSGRILDDTSIWVAQACMFVFTLSFTNAWRRSYRLLLAGFGGLCLAYYALLSVVALSEDGRLAYIAYGGYYGRPTAVLLWDVLSGLTLGYGFAMGAVGYRHILRTADDRHTTVNAWAAIAAALVGMTYGALIVVQAVANRLGATSQDIVGNAIPLALAGIFIMVGTTWVSIFGRPLWYHLRSHFSLAQQTAQLRQIRRDILNANVLLSDRLVQLHDYADPELVRSVDARCRQVGVALEAARWITIARANVGKKPWLEMQQQEHDGVIAADVRRRAESESYFYADVFRVVALTLTPDQMPALEGPLVGSAWYPAVAELLRQVLHAPETGTATSTVRTSGLSPKAATAAGSGQGLPRRMHRHGAETIGDARGHV